MTEGYTRPPRKEDLERLYVMERLSAMKIAKVYDLRYRNPKVAESTILYHLKRNGIKRRDPGEHVRKVTEAMVDEWVRKYQAGESLRTVAGRGVDPVTVWNHLKRRGLVLRDRVEAQIEAVTRHERKPFQGDSIEKAYLMGLRYGDFDAVRHGRAIRIRVSTTHPAMAELLESLFSSYGFVHRYPREAKLTRYEWTLECDLDDSFEFLLRKVGKSELELMGYREFLAFLAGFFDAEGTIYYHKKGRGGSFEWGMANSDRDVLEIARRRLSRLGFHPKFRLEKMSPKRSPHASEIIAVSPKWRLDIWKFEEVKNLLELVPLRHLEKVTKAKIAIRMGFRPEAHIREAVLDEWELLKRKISRDVMEFVSKAGEELLQRSEG